MDGLNVTTNVLDMISADGYHFEQLAAVGSVVQPTDYSNNHLANRLQTEFPLVNWLLNTASSNEERSRFSNDLLDKDKNGKWNLKFPYNVWTTPPTDTTGECCWVPFELEASGGKVPIYLFCLKYCEQLLDGFMKDLRRFGPNDLINVFRRKGETVAQAQDRMNRMSMAFFTAWNIILGTEDTQTPTLKPFHGLMQCLEDKAVLKLAGANVLAAFDSLWCRLVVMEQNDFVFWAHPLTIEGIKQVVVPGKDGKLPEGWARNGEDISFHGHPFKGDKMVSIDETAGTGEVWMLSPTAVGGWLITGLYPGDKYVRETFAHNDKPADGCAGGCKYYYNAGTVWCNNPNAMAVITDIPLGANCIGSVLNGLDGLIIPETLVPRNETEA